MENNDRIDFRIDKETKKSLESLAEKEGRSLSNLMVFISKKYVGGCKNLIKYMGKV